MSNSDSEKPAATPFFQELQNLHEAHLQRTHESDLWRLISSPDTPTPLIKQAVGELMFATQQYGPYITEAAFAAIGRLPHTDTWLLKTCTHLVLDESTHPNMAAEDQKKLRSAEMPAPLLPSAESFNIAASCRAIATTLSPFSFLGFIFLLESSTSILTQETKSILMRREIPEASTEFINLHAVEDEGHAILMSKVVQHAASGYPSAAADILYGFRCFAAVYPIPLWNAVYSKIIFKG